MFPKVPQSSLGILRVPQLPPPLNTPQESCQKGQDITSCLIFFSQPTAAKLGDNESLSLLIQLDSLTPKHAKNLVQIIACEYDYETIIFCQKNGDRQLNSWKKLWEFWKKLEKVTKKCKLEKVTKKSHVSHVPVTICSDGFTRFRSFVLDWNLLKLDPPMVQWLIPKSLWIAYGCQLKNSGCLPPTQIIHFNRVWNHDFHHPFWG